MIDGFQLYVNYVKRYWFLCSKNNEIVKKTSRPFKRNHLKIPRPYRLIFSFYFINNTRWSWIKDSRCIVFDMAWYLYRNKPFDFLSFDITHVAGAGESWDAILVFIVLFVTIQLTLAKINKLIFTLKREFINYVRYATNYLFF